MCVEAGRCLRELVHFVALCAAKDHIRAAALLAERVSDSHIIDLESGDAFRRNSAAC